MAHFKNGHGSLRKRSLWQDAGRGRMGEAFGTGHPSVHGTGSQPSRFPASSISTSRRPTWSGAETRPIASICSMSRAAEL
jgi:hypothetical protein